MLVTNLHVVCGANIGFGLALTAGQIPFAVNGRFGLLALVAERQTVKTAQSPALLALVAVGGQREFDITDPLPWTRTLPATVNGELANFAMLKRDIILADLAAGEQHRIKAVAMERMVPFVNLHARYAPNTLLSFIPCSPTCGGCQIVQATFSDASDGVFNSIFSFDPRAPHWSPSLANSVGVSTLSFGVSNRFASVNPSNALTMFVLWVYDPRKSNNIPLNR
jgi:hypothetical protein